jgi:hypothetical protein
VIHLVRGEEGTFFYYLALLLGMAMLGIYFWAIITVDLAPTYLFFQWILITGGILFVGSAFGFVSAKTRSSRVSLTMLSGILGGIHSYLIFALFTDLIVAIILFAWMAVGLLIAFAAFSWLYE